MLVAGASKQSGGGHKYCTNPIKAACYRLIRTSQYNPIYNRSENSY